MALAKRTPGATPILAHNERGASPKTLGGLELSSLLNTAIPYIGERCTSVVVLAPSRTVYIGSSDTTTKDIMHPFAELGDNTCIVTVPSPATTDVHVRPADIEDLRKLTEDYPSLPFLSAHAISGTFAPLLRLEAVCAQGQEFEPGDYDFRSLPLTGNTATLHMAQGSTFVETY